MSKVVLKSLLFSGFWIGWLIEHPTKSNSINPKKVGFLDLCWIIGLDWIGLKKSYIIGFLTSNFLDLVRMEFQSSIQSNPKSRKKVDFLILVKR
jgi:hypothetical protein